jgi:transcriptional regulator with XRE-family HTH domain
MARTEQQLIDLCIRQIEKKFAFSKGRGQRQRDLEVLSGLIENKTGTIISISTLKRLWKKDYKLSPQLATLNALAAILDYGDWQSFKQANQNKSLSLSPVVKWGIAAIVLAGIVALVLTRAIEPGEETTNEDKPRPIRITGPVTFEASKTVTSGIPNTVIFKYDVSHVIADTIFIQQSWNRNHRMAIDRTGNAVTSIYYESGFHRARLIADDSVIAMQPIHIISDGWEPHLYYSNAEPPIDLKGEDFIRDGRLQIDRGMLERRNMDFAKGFYTRITYSQVFDSVHSDNFSFATRFKVDSLFDELCPWVNLLIVTEVNVFSVGLREKGCENRVSYDLGEISRHGRDNDLSALGCHVYDWQELEIRSNDRHAGIYLNGKLTYEEDYKNDFGKVVGFIYIFGGTGSIDYARLQNADGESVYEDNF